MEAISKIVQRKEVREAFSSSSREARSVNCWRCFGTGTRHRDTETGKYLREFTVQTARQAVVAENCLCVRRRTYKAQLAAVPPAFGKPKLSRLNPRPDLHLSQASAIQFVRSNPGDSYLLVGKNGTGKSHIAWALYRFAIASRRPAVAVTVRDLLDEFKRMELSASDGDLWTPRVRAVDLRRQGKRWFLFFDEFEKARPSEFASEQLFNLLDAARDFNHQIVITSNFKIDELHAHWGRINPVWANSIMTRLRTCREIDFF